MNNNFFKYLLFSLVTFGTTIPLYSQLIASASKVNIGNVDVNNESFQIPLINQSRSTIRFVPRGKKGELNFALNTSLDSHESGVLEVGLKNNGKKRINETLYIYTDKQEKPIEVNVKMKVYGWKGSKCPEFKKANYKYKTEKKGMSNNDKPSLRIIDSKEKNQLFTADPMNAPYSHVTVLLDASVSMISNQKLDLLKEQLTGLLISMRPGDYISIIYYNEDATLVAERINASQSNHLAEIVDEISARGYTNGQEGIEKAMDFAEKQDNEELGNHVILMTDGAFNIGDDIQEITLYLEQKSKVFDYQFSVFSIWSQKDHGKYMKQLAKAGNGHYFKLSNRFKANKRMNKMLLKEMM